MQNIDSPGKKKRNISLGAAHTNPADAYKGIPFLKQPTWNHEVAAYFFLGGASAGAALIGSLAEVVGGKERQNLARTAHYVSLATLLPCPFLLIDDLGYPARFHHMLRIFKPSSPMNLGSWALTLHGAGAFFTVLTMLAHESKLPLPVLNWLGKLVPERLLAGLGVPSSFTLAGYTGVLLGTSSVPVWYTSPMLGGVFMASALSSGAAAISVTSSVTGREGHSDQRAMRAIGAAFDVAELGLLTGYVATTGPAKKHLLGGDAGRYIKGAVGALAASLVLHVAGAVSPKNERLLGGLAGLAGLAGGAMLRWGVVQAGRNSTNDREGALEAMKPRKGSPGWGPNPPYAKGKGPVGEL